MFDVIIVLIVLVFMYYGYKKGFRKRFAGIVSAIVALIAGIILYSTVALILNSTSLPSGIGGKTADVFLKNVMNYSTDNGTVHQIFGTLTYEKNKELVIGQIAVKFISFLIVFTAAYIVLRIVIKKTKILSKVKVTKQLNNVLGGALGFVSGALCVYILCGILVASEPFIPVKSVKDGIARSEIARVCYEDNYIANIVAKQEFLFIGED